MSYMLRRELLKSLAVLPYAAAAEERPPSIRPITRGPRFHWFGYYDKLQFDPTGRYVLGMESTFENRTPQADDIVTVGMIDLAGGDRWTPFGESRAWCWQQGCMLQWLPGSRSEVIWNDREGDHFVCHILDIQSRKKRTLPAPIYALSPDGKWALAPDFSRLHDWRPGYGYAGVPDRNAKVMIPRDAGIWRMSRSPKPRRSLTAAAIGPAPAIGLITCCFRLTEAASVSCMAGACGNLTATSRSPRGCLRRGRTARDSTRSTLTATHRTTSGATHNTSWRGPGILRMATSSTCFRTRRTRWRWLGRR